MPTGSYELSSDPCFGINQLKYREKNTGGVHILSKRHWLNQACWKEGSKLYHDQEPQ